MTHLLLSDLFFIHQELLFIITIIINDQVIIDISFIIITSIMDYLMGTDTV